MEPTEDKGLEIAAKSNVIAKIRATFGWFPHRADRNKSTPLPCATKSRNALVGTSSFANAKCKHIFAVEYTIQREQTADGRMVVTETVKVTRETYSQNSPAYNAAQTQEKSQL